MEPMEMLDAVRELARAAEEARRGLRKALEAIHRYRQPDRWERYAAQEALLGDVLRRLGELEKELERCIVLDGLDCAPEALERRYAELCMEAGDVVATVVSALAKNQGCQARLGRVGGPSGPLTLAFKRGNKDEVDSGGLRTGRPSEGPVG